MIKINPLEWPKEPSHNGIYTTKYTGLGITYTMRIQAPNRVSWSCNQVYGWISEDSEPAAKAAAQADYEARILSCIDTAGTNKAQTGKE